MRLLPRSNQARPCDAPRRREGTAPLHSIFPSLASLRISILNKYGTMAAGASCPINVLFSVCVFSILLCNSTDLCSTYQSVGDIISEGKNKHIRVYRSVASLSGVRGVGRRTGRGAGEGRGRRKEGEGGEGGREGEGVCRRRQRHSSADGTRAMQSSQSHAHRQPAQPQPRPDSGPPSADVNR